MLNGNKKKKVNKSVLVNTIKYSEISGGTTYDILTDKDRKELYKDIDSLSKNKRISVVVIEYK